MSFFGGGTDYPAWYREHGGAVLATTINRYCYLTCRFLPPFFEHKSRIVWSHIEKVADNSEIKHPVVNAVLDHLGVNQGVEIHHDGDLPSRTGLGSSSSFTVGILNGLYALKGERLGRMDLAKLAIHIEQDCLKENVGVQDQIQTAHGGLNRIEFYPDGTFEVAPLDVTESRVRELENHILMFYTGVSRHASQVAKAQIDAIPDRQSELHRMRELVDLGIDILSNSGDITDFGRLLHESWQLKRSLTTKIAPSFVDDIYARALAAGALGGKLLGAGGGGFMIFFVPPENHLKVLKALDELMVVPVEFENSGSQIIFYNNPRYSRTVLGGTGEFKRYESNGGTAAGGSEKTVATSPAGPTAGHRPRPRDERMEAPSYFGGQKVLVAGGTGLIGRPLVEMLVDAGAEVRVVSLDEPSTSLVGADFRRADLRDFNHCLNACDGMDYVFQLAGVKGSPAMTAKRPASFFVPTITFGVNMMEAARQCDVNRYLFTSSIGVYAPAEVFREDDMWKASPSPNDRFAGWAKRMGELQAEAYAIEYGWDNVSIVRPANVYGPFDNFDGANAMVIPSLIKRAMDGEIPLTVWGDGSPVRDFIHARDVARGMMLVMEKGYSQPVNLGSGTGVAIREIAETIAANIPGGLEIVWDTSKPSGDKKRLMDITRAKSLGFELTISLAEGIKEAMAWYAENSGVADNRYSAFTDRSYAGAAR